VRPGHRHRLSLRATILDRLGGCALVPLWLPLVLAGCGGGQAPAGAKTVLAGETVSLITHGWHTDIGLPSAEATGPLARFRSLFPGARTLVFGYGKRTFMIAPAHSIGEWIIGPFPGPAAIEVSAISADAATGYGARHVETLALPPGGAEGLSAFLWQAFAQTPEGTPRYIAQGNFPGSLFYQASSRYGLLHTCNTWSAEALAAGGLPVHPAGIIFSGTLDERVRVLSRQ
jgi:hypothetical protein